MKQTSTTLAALAVVTLMAGCTAVGELAYDSAANRERLDCERFASMADRQACLQRIDAAAKQAAALRKKPCTVAAS